MIKRIIFARDVMKILKFKNNKRVVTMTFSTAGSRQSDETILQMNYDVVTVGGGPAGLATAIKLKQLANSNNMDISVCLIDKGSVIGSHIISGNVFEPRALEELFPDWKTMSNKPPLETAANSDNFSFLFKNASIPIPHMLLPSQLNNDGNYIISLSQLCTWLAEQAEALGVEIYSGFAADKILYGQDGRSVIGVATKDAGISKSGDKKDSFTKGIELIGKQTVFAEGARGSCTEEIISKFDLRKGKDVQTYGLGIKEVWRIPVEKCKPGFVQHTVGWPLDQQTFGGTFLYHQAPDLVHLGMVVGLDYKNTYINPYQEFQRWKTHKLIADQLQGGECISYGARCLNEGGYHAIPKLTFPGGLLVGCSAGFLNAVKIKGSHTAMKSGILAAEAIFEFLKEKSSASNDNTDNVTAGAAVELMNYEAEVHNSWIIPELKIVRNSHAAFKYGLVPGMLHTALSCFVTKGQEPWTIHNNKPDSSCTLPADKCKPIQYPKPDNKLTFDLLTNLQRSGTNHDHDQPSHLKIKPHLLNVPSEVSYPIYNGPEQRFCPAGVYEYADIEEGDANSNTQKKKKLVINAQNCVHCKCCSIKTPGEYIKWTVPEGGGGPGYTIM